MFFRRNEMRNDLRHGSHSRRSWAYANGLEERDSDDLEPLNLGKREGNSLVRRRARRGAELGLRHATRRGQLSERLGSLFLEVGVVVAVVGLQLLNCHSEPAGGFPHVDARLHQPGCCCVTQ